MQLNNVTIGGKLFNFDALSEMTKTDLPKALEMMSQMYINGQLNTQVMQKMFTARHFMEISNLLIDINGNIDGFVDGIAKGVEYSDDFYKKMFDINEQWKMLKNNITASMASIGKDVIQSLTGLSMALNESFSGELSSKIFGISKTLIGLLGSAVAVSGVLKGVVFAFTSVLSIPGAIVTGLLASAGYLAKKYYEMKSNIADFNINLSESAKLHAKLQNEVGGLLYKYENIQKVVSATNKENLWAESSLGQASSILDVILSKTKDFSDLLDSLRKTKKLDEFSMPIGIQSEISVLQERERVITGQMKREEEEMYKFGLNAFKSYNLGFLKNSDKLFKDKMNKAETFMKAYIDILKGKGSIEDKTSEGFKLAESLGLTSIEVDDTIKSLSAYAPRIQDINEDLKEAREDIGKTNEKLTQAMKDYQADVSDNVMANNKLRASLNQLKLTDFMKTGSISFTSYINEGKDGFKALTETFKGHAGIVELATRSITDQIDIQNNAFDTTIDKYRTQKEFLENILTTQGKLTEEQAKELVNAENTIKLTERNKEAFKEENKGKIEAVDRQKTLFSEMIKSYTATEKNIGLMLQYWFIVMDMEEQMSKEKDVSGHKEYLDALLKALNTSEKEYKSKQRTTDYQLKYNNYVKENLSVELELAKLLQSQGKQQLLTLEYKKRELEMNKELIADEVKLARETLAKRGMSSKGITTSIQAQSELRNMYKMYGAETKDEKIKDKFEALKILTQALVRSEKNAIETALIPLKEFEDISKNLPSIMERVYTSMQGDNPSVLSGANQDYIKFLERDSKLALQTVRKSWSEDINGNPILNPFEGLTQENINKYIAEFRDKVEQSRLNARGALEKREQGKPLTEEESKLIGIYSIQTRQLEDLLGLEEGRLNLIKRKNELEQARLDIYNKMGSVLSSLGKGMNLKGLEDVGGIFSSFGNVTKSFDKNKGIKFGDIIDFKNKDWADNFGKAMENALASIDMGSVLGSWIGGITGGGASSQAGGALGGLIAGAGGADALAGAMGMAGSALATGGASLAISAGMALIGGLFDSGKGDEEKAQKKTAEAKKIYDKNTEALNKLAQNMSNLSGGIDGLNSSLISAFSKIPTFGKLTSVTDTLRNMYSTMEKTRQFNEVAYQVTKTKKGKKGFLGIGATAGTSWTETIEVSVQEMLNKYGFKGAIEDMTTNQLRDFSKWLEDFDMGDSDNFSVLAGAIEDYAEALDTFDKNINKFFYDTTMESFTGISSLQQEELRQQIEEFYKNLGFQIDDEMSKVIEDLANEMSVMVTIMQDVRGSFVDTWRDSGKTAGQNFLSSMTPYIDAMLENISQVFYDVYFSDVTGALEGEFKALSEQLVELKKQGSDLNWDTVASSLSGSFDKVLNAIISAKQESTDFNDILMQLQKQALEAGLSLSELLELGLVSGTQKTVLDSFKDALLSSDSESALTSIGKMVGDKVGEAMADKLIDNMLSDKVLQFSANIDKVLSGGMNFDSLSGLASEAMSVGMMMETERKRLEAIKDMFSFDGTVSYESQESSIQYSQGVSQNVTQYVYLNSSVEVSNLVESDSIHTFVKQCADDLLDVLKDRGMDITKVSY